VLSILRKLHLLLTREQKRKYLLLQLMFGLTALIQVAGIASLAPFIGLLANRKLIHDNPITAYVYNSFGFQSDIGFLIFFAGCVMAFIIVANAVSALTAWFSVVFSQNLGLELQGSLYRSYLHKDYVYFGKNNSSKMIAMITQEAPRFTYMVLQPMLALISQVFVVLIIVTGLLLIDPTTAIAASLVIGGGYVYIFRSVKLRLGFYGYRQFEANNKKFKVLNESLGGIKEVKLLGTEQMYEKGLGEANTVSTRSAAIIGLLGDLPRHLIETMAFCALLGLVIYMLDKHGDSEKIISLLSLYAMAGYKLLPAAQTIFKSAAQIKANGSTMDELYPDVKEGREVVIAEQEIAPLPIAGNGDIRLLDVTYTYPGSEGPAVKNIDLTIRKNTIVAFVGASGAGKSTLADIVLGFLSPTAGRMLVGDTEINAGNAKAWQKHLGYVPQNIFLVDDTLTNNITFGAIERKIDLDKVKAAAKMANIDHFIESLPEQYDFVAGERGSLLSGGQRQRVGIARALYHDADVLVLDEATSALDSITEKEIIATIVRLKTTKTIVMIAHRLSTIRSADQVVFFEGGSIQDIGTFDELSRRNAKFRAMIQSTPETSEPVELVQTLS
jgi:HlyD family secretion protein